MTKNMEYIVIVGEDVRHIHLKSDTNLTRGFKDITRFLHELTFTCSHNFL